MPPSLKKWSPVLTLAMLLLLPVLVGVAVAEKWPHADDTFYSSVSQIIATLFIAIAVEFFGQDKTVWEDDLDRIMVLGLIAFSWSGLFACIRAMVDRGTGLTSGVAAAGLMSASVLVSLALFARVRVSAFAASAVIMFVFLLPPLLLLIFL